MMSDIKSMQGKGMKDDVSTARGSFNGKGLRASISLRLNPELVVK